MNKGGLFFLHGSLENFLLIGQLQNSEVKYVFIMAPNLLLGIYQE